MYRDRSRCFNWAALFSVSNASFSFAEAFRKSCKCPVFLKKMLNTYIYICVYRFKEYKQQWRHGFNCEHFIKLLASAKMEQALLLESSSALMMKPMCGPLYIPSVCSLEQTDLKVILLACTLLLPRSDSELTCLHDLCDNMVSNLLQPIDVFARLNNFQKAGVIFRVRVLL